MYGVVEKIFSSLGYILSLALNLPLTEISYFLLSQFFGYSIELILPRHSGINPSKIAINTFFIDFVAIFLTFIVTVIANSANDAHFEHIEISRYLDRFIAKHDLVLTYIRLTGDAPQDTMLQSYIYFLALEHYPDERITINLYATIRSKWDYFRNVDFSVVDKMNSVGSDFSRLAKLLDKVQDKLNPIIFIIQAIAACYTLRSSILLSERRIKPFSNIKKIGVHKKKNSH